MIKTFTEMMKVDVSKYLKERDGSKYLPWARCKELLHLNGAETVYFEPCTNDNGSSLFMSDQTFTDKNGITNKCYEVRVKITIDSDVFYMQTPVMNGGNPVKDNSMTQQRVWNAQTRAFVKGAHLAAASSSMPLRKGQTTLLCRPGLSSLYRPSKGGHTDTIPRGE